MSGLYKADKGAGNDLKTSSRHGGRVENRLRTHPLMLFGNSIASPGKKQRRDGEIASRYEKCGLNIYPRLEDVTIAPSECGDLVTFVAVWRNAREAGSIAGLWQKSRRVLQISDLLVKADLLVSRLPLLPIEKRANFRRLGIGRRLLHAMVDYARQNGASRVYGSVVEQDIHANRDLLGWYAREGFTIGDPDEECLKNAVSKIEMRFEEGLRGPRVDGHDHSAPYPRSLH